MALLSPQRALEELVAGNLRFASQKREYPNLSTARIARTGREGQQPFAAILACSDSRGPVEHIFDAGVGDLFVVRIAGNQASNEAIGSLEFCIETIGTRLVVVLGHTDCGAVAAAAGGMRAHGLIPRILAGPLKAIGRVQRHQPNAAPMQLAAEGVVENVWLAVEEILRNSRAVSSGVAGGRLAVLGAVYDVSTGKVDWLGEHPRQSKLAR